MALRGIERLRAEGIFILKTTIVKGRCCVARCRKPGKVIKGSPHFLCHRHLQQRWRLNSPKQSAYANLRDHAKARGLEFSLDEKYFAGFMDCAAAWDLGAEKRGDKVTIDRRDETIGYREGNLQVLTLSENVAKINRIRHLPAYVQSILARKRAKAQKIMESHEEWQERHGVPF